jgi:death-on-curing protein
VIQPLFLDLDEVIEIHNDQLDRYGGQAGIRDVGLLTSALAQPQATFGGAFLHPDLPAMAAAYLFHIVQNHPFIDGNKRAGAMCAYVFLAMNDRELNAPEDAFEHLVWQVATGAMEKDRVADFIRIHTIEAV